MTWCAGEQADLSGELVLASVQKLSRAQPLEALARERFDYVVVDEVHHDDADSYRKVLDRLTGWRTKAIGTPDLARAGRRTRSLAAPARRRT